MYCPQCSQQISEQTSFCSRCGFLLTGVTALLANGGTLPGLVKQDSKLHEKPSPRQKGLKQGGILIILGTLIVPLAAVTEAPDDMLGALSLIFFLGGFLRIVYAFLFQSKLPQEKGLSENIADSLKKVLPGKVNGKSLPPISDDILHAANWRDTNDLTPVSVTENTTTLLSKTHSETD